ncbi:hypothetical protein SAMN05443667_103251 [Flavobacterium gillisiae]|uniref:Uncharacterized protein n=1 Tax=Flavobacterium gillisiae TaxID=150146 RepID=A0A1H4A923_9FLAO|nr:hypothetical protein SAMN05443667_103251 [Flavobacterium gillisiae]
MTFDLVINIDYANFVLPSSFDCSVFKKYISYKFLPFLFFDEFGI